MIIFRKNKIPIIFTTIPWIRKSFNNLFVDCEEDMPVIEQIQNVCMGKLCLSSFEERFAFYIKAIFPENWNDLRGKSDELQAWHHYYWKLQDLINYIDDGYITDGQFGYLTLAEAEISFDYLDSIRNPISCVPILKELYKCKRRVYENWSQRNPLTGCLKRRDEIEEQRSYFLTELERIEKVIKIIKNVEPELISEAKLKKMKGSDKSYIVQDKIQIDKNINQQITPKLRMEILRRAGYRCVFCGTTSTDSELQVDHIISKSLVNKLNLDKHLFIAKFNLCITCRNCNIAKSDYLYSEDIDYYSIIFSNKSHPNNEILSYLNKIREIQDL